MPTATEIKKHHFGLPAFAMTLADDGGNLSLRASVGQYDLGLRPLDLFGKQGQPLIAEVALAFLVDNWREVAGPYCGSPWMQKATVDLGGLLGPGRTGPVLRRDGVLIGFDAMTLLHDLDGYSVTVIECLLRLGDLLSDRVSDERMKDSWIALWAATEVLPMDIDGSDPFDDEQNEADFERETLYFAKLLHKDAETYRLEAIWVEAAQTLWQMRDRREGAEPEPEASRDPTLSPGVLPSADEIAGAVAQAEPLSRYGEGKFRRAAVRSRNSLLRGPLVYARWKPEGGRPYPNATGFSGGLPVELNERLTSFDPETGKGVLTPGRWRGGPLAFSYTGLDRDGVVALVGKEVKATGAGEYATTSTYPVGLVARSIELDQLAVRRRALHTRVV